MKLLFLLSLPRSGSTLLQRLLMGHPEVASCGEPWLALPLSMMDKGDEAFATYGHFSSARALNNLFENLEGGRGAFMKEAGGFIERVYQQLNSSGAEYFLDKTPRYYKIIDDLKLMFPQAKFIFLTREPLSVFGSIVNYVDGNAFRLPTWEQDIVEGVSCLSRAVHGVDSSSMHVRYESLVINPQLELKRIFSFLGLQMDAGILETLADRDINMGDPHGAKKYEEVSSDSLEGWKRSINTGTKKRVAYNWLSQVPAEDYEAFGTTKKAQLGLLDEHKVPFDVRDWFSWMIGAAYFYNNINALRWSFKRRKANRHPSVY